MLGHSFNAIKGLSTRIPLSEKIKALTGLFGIRLDEEQEYFLIRSNGDNEIRKYNALMLASITMPINGDTEATQAYAYQDLNDYIFGKNQQSQQIAKTSVWTCKNSQHRDGSDFITMSFILSSKYNNENIPAPIDQRIKIHQQPPQMIACRSYSGPSIKEKVLKHSEELKSWVKQYSSYIMADDVEVAEYDRPSTLPFLRKNEVRIAVKGVS